METHAMKWWNRYVYLLAAVALLSIAGVQAAFAQTGQGTTGVQTFTLAPGASATVTFEAFCTEFGQEFPSAVQAPNATAPDRVRAALAYARQQNLIGSNEQALQVQYALWQLLGAVDSPRGEQAAQDIVSQAGSTPPAAPQGARSVVEASQANQVRLTVASWQPLGEPVQITQTATDNFYGRGTLTVENISQQELTLYMTIGTIFPAVNQAEQDMAGYATNIQTNDPGVSQAATAAPTTAATAAATATTGTTATVATTATTAATATVAATAITAPTTAATATTTAPSTLPNTSGGAGSSLLLLLAAALALLAFGGHVVRGFVRR
jgi:hypothetical protein